MAGWNMPDGCSEYDIPGWDNEWFLCPVCGWEGDVCPGRRGVIVCPDCQESFDPRFKEPDDFYDWDQDWHGGLR
jgi:hypothetical protein